MVTGLGRDLPVLTVFFDGGCPLCRKEIAFYRRRSGAERIRWVNVEACADRELPDGLSRCDALQRFHTRDAQGRLHSGARGFAELWSALPAFRLIGLLFRNRPMGALLEITYRVFLRIRPLIPRRPRGPTEM